MVLIMKPKVGLTRFTSSFMIFFTIVVFPALSRPLLSVSKSAYMQPDTYSIKMRISLSFSLAFRKMDNILKNFVLSCEKTKSKSDAKLLHVLCHVI